MGDEPIRTDDIYAPAFVKSVFDRCSGRYIAFSYACSFGFTERWRRQCVAAMPDPGTPMPIGYDLMAGTGEVWPHLLRRFPALVRIVAVDISSGMHQLAMKRLRSHRARRIDFIEDDVLASDLEDGSADFIVSTFGLKTFDAAQQAKLAELVARVLKPGGSFSMIEASDPQGWWLRPLYLFHLRVVLPLVERLFLSGARDFAMIGTYSMNFNNAAGMADLLRAQGLKVTFHRHFFGCATGVAGTKPPQSIGAKWQRDKEESPPTGRTLYFPAPPPTEQRKKRQRKKGQRKIPDPAVDE